MNKATKILVVDDEPGMREGCRKVLVASDYEVETAPDGVAGLELLQKGGRFAAALIDLKMPRMGGIELIEEIRKLDPDIFVFVITAYATVATAVEATKKGAYGYIPKPFTPDELMLAVSNGLEKRALSLEARRLREERERRLLEVAFERSKSHTIINCWYERFAGRGGSDPLSVGRDVDAVSGATLTARATTEGVRRMLAYHATLLSH